MIVLTEQQRQELEGAEPVVLDPLTQQRYILVREETYQRLRSALDPTVYTSAETLDRVLAQDDAADPYLAELQKKYGGAL